MDNFDLKRFLIENHLTRNSTLLNENQVPQDIEEFLSDMINFEVLDDLSDDIEEGDNVNGVWDVKEYGNEEEYGDAADDFKKAYQYIKDNGGKITIPGNPDVKYDALYDGSIGYSLYVTLNELAKSVVWTPEKLEQEAEKYDTTTEFRQAASGAYQAYRNAVNKGLIQDKFEGSKFAQRNWTKDALEQEADKYTTSNEFRQANINAYQAYRIAVNKGLIQNKFEKQFKWTPEKLEQEADKYTTSGEFQKANASAYTVYRIAVKKGLIPDKFEKQFKWTPEKLEQEADKYNKPSEFQKANISAYNIYRTAVRKGLIKDKFKPTKDASSTSQSTSLSINYPDNNPYFGTPTTTFDKLKENKMQDFDLKKFLVENKMTRNSRLLNEQPESSDIPADDPLAQIPEVPAETPSEPSGEIDKETAKELIFDTKGKFFTVTFIKKDGSERVMNARLGVKKYLKGGTLKYNPEDFNYITVYDMGAKDYRTVNANTIQKLKIGKNEYTVPTAVSESQRLNEEINIQDIKDEMKDFYSLEVSDEDVSNWLELYHYDRIEDDPDYDGDFVFDTGEREDFYIYLQDK
jgi:hypothetical protein